MTVSEIHFNNRSRIHSLTRDGGRGAHPCGGGVYCVKADFLRLTLRNAALESTEMSWERPSASHPQAGAVWVLWSMQTDIGCFTGDSIGSLFIYLPFTMTSWVSCHEAPVGQWFLLLHLRGTTEQMIDTIFAALFERCHSTLSLKLCVWRRLCLTFLTIKKQKKQLDNNCLFLSLITAAFGRHQRPTSMKKGVCLCSCGIVPLMEDIYKGN